MRAIDGARAYLAARGNGWSHGEARETAELVRASGGLVAVKSLLHSAGGFSGNNTGWPNSFRKLTDSWPERTGQSASGVSLDQFWSCSTVQANLSFIQRTFPEARPRVLDGEGEDAEEILGHPLTRLLNRPNPFYTAHRLWQVTLADWWVTGRGNAYWRIVRGGYREPVELWHLPAAEVEPDWPRDGSAFISHYRRTVNGKTEELDPRDVVHFRFGQDPHNSRKGWSPLLAGALEVANLNEGGRYRVGLLERHGVPSYALTPQNEQVAQGMDEPTIELLQRLWQEKHTGAMRGGLFVPNFAAKLDRVGYSPQELDIRQMLGWDADMVCALFGLSSMVLGLPSGEEHRTFANMAEARESAFESNIVPTQALMAADLELQLLPEFDSDESHHVGWDYSRVRVLQDDQDKLYTRLDQAVTTGWLAPNEARKKVSLPALKGGDEPKPLSAEVREDYQQGIITRNEARKRRGLPPVKEEAAAPAGELEAGTEPAVGAAGGAPGAR
jgi:HK97 family phage portal protein